MARQLTLLAALCVLLALPGPASALDVGVTEDEGNTNPEFVYATLQDLGMTTNVMSIRWNPLDPLALPANFADIRNAASVAAARGVGVILATYQDRSTGITDTPNAPAVFAEWLTKVAQECPLCARKVIVLNEPNLQFFFRPTFDAGCRAASPAAYARVLAAAYDALKAVDETIRVYGLGLSPRGNDNCLAVSNVSMSPVTFLSELGKAYRAMGRALPLMDGLSFHPYPNSNADGPATGYRWPNAGVPNLDRVKQAFHDAFAGTTQPVIGVAARAASGRRSLQPITVAIDELGWQVATDSWPGYTETENVPTVTEEQQAAWYADVIRRYACDPSVESLNFFHLRDEADRRRFQSGLIRLDGSTRPAYDAVKAAIAEASTCAGRLVRWTPARGVIGAKAVWPAARRLPRGPAVLRFQITAEERASYRAQLVALARPAEGKKLANVRGPLAAAAGEIRAYFRPFVTFRGRLEPGAYVVRIRVSAALNPARTTTLTSRPFVVR
ncbi:MAG: hypothetical protein ICV67_06575 [Thermoleophilia bacterium]|nr:hypothetical protein [Thermoleophilia bacterium]